MAGVHRRHYVLGVLVLVAAASMAVGTGADTVTYDEVDTLELRPAGEGLYVQENEDGEIRIDVTEDNGKLEADGVNDDAITDLGPVFEIENVLRLAGTEPAPTQNRVTVWIEDDDANDAVRFYEAGTDAEGEALGGRSMQSEAEGVTLSPEETAEVGMVVDTTGEHPDLSEITIHASVENLAFERIEATLGGEPVSTDRTDGHGFDLNEEPDLTVWAVAEDGEGDEARIDVTDRATIEDSSETVEVGPDGRTITTVNPDGGHPESGWIEVGVGDHTRRFAFPLEWRETYRPVVSDDTTARFEQLGVVDHVAFEKSLGGSVTVEAFTPEDAPDVGDRGAIQVVDVSVPEADGPATIVFALPESRIDADPEDLTVLHETDDGVEELESVDVAVEDGTVRIRAETPGFSTFAVADGTVDTEAVETSGAGSGSRSGADSSTESETNPGASDPEAPDSDGDPDGGGGGADADVDPGESGGGGGGATDADADGGAGAYPVGTDSSTADAPGPTELGGLTLSPPWFLLALAAASLLLVFAYRRRREDEEA